MLEFSAALCTESGPNIISFPLRISWNRIRRDVFYGPYYRCHNMNGSLRSFRNESVLR
jgi:hypothetical protein